MILENTSPTKTPTKSQPNQTTLFASNLQSALSYNALYEAYKKDMNIGFSKEANFSDSETSSTSINLTAYT